MESFTLERFYSYFTEQRFQDPLLPGHLSQCRSLQDRGFGELGVGLDVRPRLSHRVGLRPGGKVPVETHRDDEVGGRIGVSISRPRWEAPPRWTRGAWVLDRPRTDRNTRRPDRAWSWVTPVHRYLGNPHRRRFTLHDVHCPRAVQVSESCHPPPLHHRRQ